MPADRSAGGARLAEVTRRFLSLARPPEAAVLVNGHPELARICGAQGVQLGAGDLPPEDARSVMGSGWIGVSVHDEPAAEAAAAAGADFLMIGSIYRSASHPGLPPAGPGLITRCARLGLPTIAIGGMTTTRAREVREAGAYGVAAISALWDAEDPAAAATSMLTAWTEASYY